MSEYVFIGLGEEVGELSKEAIDIIKQRIDYADKKLADDLNDYYYRKGLSVKNQVTE